MSLNAKNVAMTGGGKSLPKQDALEAGTYPARVVSIFDLGLQPQRPYQGQEKAPKQEIRITYELLDEFVLGEDGEEMGDKPRWVSEEMAFNNLEVDLAKSTKRYKALDPSLSLEGDFTQLLGLPCLVSLSLTEGTGKNKGRQFNNVSTIAQMRSKDANKAAPLVNPPKFFSCGEPDMEVFLSLPEFLQDKIKSNLEYNGSVLQEAVQGKKGGSKEKPTKPEKKADLVADAEGGDEEW